MTEKELYELCLEFQFGDVNGYCIEYTSRGRWCKELFDVSELELAIHFCREKSKSPAHSYRCKLRRYHDELQCWCTIAEAQKGKITPL